MSKIFVENAMSRLLSLYESKSKPVSSTSKAALMQLFSHVISNLVTENLKQDEGFGSDEEVKEETTDGVKSDLPLQISSALLKGIVSHLNSTKYTLWPVPINNSTT
jgi:hypothetical protein